MTARRPHCFFADLIRRLVAGGSAALMLLLVTLAASPELHERFHSAGTPGNDDGCAVVLFANGVSLTNGAIAIPRPEAVWVEPVCTPVEKLFLVSSRYLRQPERGPPAS